MEEQNNNEMDKDSICILITTNDNIIRGELFLNSDVYKNDIIYPDLNSILFNILNSGKNFIMLRNCYVTSKRDMVFKPEYVEAYYLNVNVVQSCKILKEEDL